MTHLRLPGLSLLACLPGVLDVLCLELYGNCKMNFAMVSMHMSHAAFGFGQQMQVDDHKTTKCAGHGPSCCGLPSREFLLDEQCGWIS